MSFRLNRFNLVAQPSGTLLTNLAEILSKSTDMSGRHVGHYTIPKAVKGNDGAVEKYELCISYSPQTRCFGVLQTIPGRPFRNSFHVKEDDSEIVSFCDHVPSMSFVEAVSKGIKLPTSTELFDLENCQEPNPVEHVKSVATQVVTELGKWGVLDTNINPKLWHGRKTRL